MREFIKTLKERDLINRIQNRIFIRIGLFQSSILSNKIQAREIDHVYCKKQLDIQDERLLKEYAARHRGKNHFEKNILPRLINNNRFTGFAVIDVEKDEIAYLCWIDFENITIPEINYFKDIRSEGAYFLDDHCVNHHQRKGLHNTMFNERFLFCQKRGVKEVFITIYLNNIRALQNLKKYNFKLINKFSFYPFLKK